MDLQCPNWKIGLEVEDFLFLTFIWPKIWPFLHIFEPPYTLLHEMWAESNEGDLEKSALINPSP